MLIFISITSSLRETWAVLFLILTLSFYLTLFDNEQVIEVYLIMLCISLDHSNSIFLLTFFPTIRMHWGYNVGVEQNQCANKSFSLMKWNATIFRSPCIGPSLSDKDQKERARRSEFVRGLVLSTIFEETLWGKHSPISIAASAVPDATTQT